MSKSFIKKTLESMVNQELLPEEWVIVNDNSTDDTAAIVAEYMKLYPWIKLVNKLDEDDRKNRSKGCENFLLRFRSCVNQGF